MLGLSFDKLLLVGFVAAILLGPERLPEFASRLRQIIARVKELLDGTQSRIREEMGPEFDEVDWRKLDPRQYDPRRIMREALSGEVAPSTSAAVGLGKPPSTRETLQSERGESATDHANISPISIEPIPGRSTMSP